MPSTEERMTDPVTARQFHADPTLAEWRVVGDGACTHFRTRSFAQSARLVDAIAELRDIDDHPPDVDVRRDGVSVRLVTSTGEYYGIGRLDVEAARRISAAARELGLSGDPSGVQSLLVIPGAPITAAVMPFWRAVLGYEPRGDTPDEDLVDPRGRGPAFWFERMREPRQGAGAIHVAVWVPPEEAETRVAAALAAGGRLVRDQFAPAWWTLADAAGNEADIATTSSRD
jgi:4a-hydroxytetrahydrobiopterin dehydratase